MRLVEFYARKLREVAFRSRKCWKVQLPENGRLDSLFLTMKALGGCNYTTVHRITCESLQVYPVLLKL
jgi:hypothetical protein